MTHRIGLALGGGGARGFAHLGVLTALHDARIPVHAIAGTSMGAAMGSLLAIGADLPKVRILLRCLRLNDLLQVSDSTLRELQKLIGRSVVEYVRGSTWKEDDARPDDLKRLEELFSLLTARKTFADTHIPLAVVAADMNTGERVTLRDGPLAQAITASTAVPGVFTPVSRAGRYLLDGGIVEKLPIDVVIDMGATAAIAVDTGAPLTRNVDTALDAILQSQRITSSTLTALQTEQARVRLDGQLVLIQPDVGWIKMFDFEHVDDAVQAGIDAARAHLDDVRRLL